jgi:hypothetical protein
MGEYKCFYKLIFSTSTSSQMPIPKAFAITLTVSREGEVSPRSIEPMEFLLKSASSASFS